jgi:Methyltransferase domain
MPEMIADPGYWSQRLEQALKGDLHTAVFRCPLDRWLRIEAKHREILERTVKPLDSILDCGCGWGRLLKLMPVNWWGRYLGVDLAPAFVKLAQELYPNREFEVGSLTHLPFPDIFDLAILISIRPMVKRNLGEEEWDKMEVEIRKHARKLLYLEYDESDEGSLE